MNNSDLLKHEIEELDLSEFEEFNLSEIEFDLPEVDFDLPEIEFDLSNYDF